MGSTLEHPYGNDGGRWVRGSFHGHCRESSGCSSVPLAEGIRRYHGAGVAFVAVTDHDLITELTKMRARYPEMVLLEGFEYSTRENIVFAGEHVPPLYELPLEEALKRAGGEIVTIVCHPKPRATGTPYWTYGKLAALGIWPDGIEIYNGHYGTEVARTNGRQPLGTELWDEVLTAGHRLWGYGNDDFHDPDDFGNAWNMVQVEEETPGEIVAAARDGRCYATTGLLLRELSIDGEHVRVELADSARGVFVGPNGERLAAGVGTSFEYRVGDAAYVRFEAEGDAGRIFLQPVFRG